MEIFYLNFRDIYHNAFIYYFYNYIYLDNNDYKQMNLKIVCRHGAVRVTLKIPLNIIKLFLLKKNIYIYISHISKTVPGKK